jgi:hypothetical protein
VDIPLKAVGRFDIEHRNAAGPEPSARFGTGIAPCTVVNPARSVVMNFCLWLMLGALISLMDRFLAPELRWQRIAVNAIYCEIGAVAAGCTLVPVDRWFSLSISWPGLMASSVGAGAMLATAHLRERKT